MPGSDPDALPPIPPPGGAPVASEAPVLTGPPVVVDLDTVPAWDPESPEGPVLRLRVAEGVEILEATGGLTGTVRSANLESAATPGDGLTLIDFGDPRPVTKIVYSGAATVRLMIQLGGSWILPAKAGGVNFAVYDSGDPFPELISAKVLLRPLVTVSELESKTHPTHVALRATDGGVPFFFHRGELRPAGARVPDFAQQLTLALESCEPTGGVCTLDLVARSETFGTVAMPSAQVLSRAAHNSLVDPSFEDLPFEDRTRALIPGADPPDPFSLPVPEDLTLPAGRPAVTAVALNLAALGFGPFRAATGGRRGAVVSDRFQVAQAVAFDQALAVAAVHLYLLRRAPRAALTVELRAEAGGEPRGALLASASQPAGDLAEDAFSWLRMGFEEPVAVAAGARLWIVLSAGEGDVEWRGDEAPADGEAALFSSDRGNTWQPHPLAASFVFEASLSALETPLTLTLGADDQEQPVIYDPQALPLLLDGDAPLVRGINQAIESAAGDPGEPLPATIELTMKSDAALPVQVTLTRLDVTYTQTLAVGTA